MLTIAICAAVVAAGLVAAARWTREAPPAVPLGRYVAVCLGAGALAGMVASGAGARLVMRLLALTSPDADGQFTEGGAQVGAITADGTLGLVLFAGLPGGLLGGVLYALAGPLIARGRAGGLALGAILLVLVGWWIEPLRPGNFDFNLLGPGWLAVLAFTAIALFQGVLTVALAARLSRGAPSRRPSGRALLAGRIALAVAVLAALPGFASAVADIVAG